MRLSELDYDLPKELIAQEPLARRDEARLLVLDRKTKSVEHSRFYKLVRHQRPPARLRGVVQRPHFAHDSRRPAKNGHSLIHRTISMHRSASRGANRQGCA